MLYTTRFYNLLKKKIRPDSAVVVQTTSPLMARKSFWCIAETLEAAGFETRPYYNAVPSFGIWGYTLAGLSAFDIPKQLRGGVQTKYLNSAMMPSMFEFSSDTSRPEEPLEVNRLDNQSLVRYYEEEWRRFEQ